MVHCEDGDSRGPAVAVGLSRIYLGHDETYFLPGMYQPNPWVLSSAAGNGEKKRKSVISDGILSPTAETVPVALTTCLRGVIRRQVQFNQRQVSFRRPLRTLQKIPSNLSPTPLAGSISSVIVQAYPPSLPSPVGPHQARQGSERLRVR